MNDFTKEEINMALEYTYQAELFIKLAIDLINLDSPLEAKMQLDVSLDKLNGLRNLIV